MHIIYAVYTSLYVFGRWQFNSLSPLRLSVSEKGRQADSGMCIICCQETSTNVAPYLWIASSALYAVQFVVINKGGPRCNLITEANYGM